MDYTPDCTPCCTFCGGRFQEEVPGDGGGARAGGWGGEQKRPEPAARHQLHAKGESGAYDARRIIIRVFVS
eukprot:9499984-Pyramimonas_sp.AAC.1